LNHEEEEPKPVGSWGYYFLDNADYSTEDSTGYVELDKKSLSWAKTQRGRGQDIILGTINSDSQF